jgi:hypothetical protein
MSSAGTVGKPDVGYKKMELGISHPDKRLSAVGGGFAPEAAVGKNLYDEPQNIRFIVDNQNPVSPS